MKKFFLLFILFSETCFAQYAPVAGQPGTTAMYKDSSDFIAWATGSSIQRGYQDISDPSLGYATAGDSTSVIGIAGTSVVSLGDGGSAIVTFLYPVKNGPSWDFAIFENSFSNDFLELAFVEVSSDGTNYFRFPAHSLTDTSTQVASFGSVNAVQINNLAGKYRGLYGTPFDLQELSGISGLDLDHIRKIKIIDVVGCIQNQYASHDSAGRKVNDPWPTPFPSSGFDLDAVGVIHHNTVEGIEENKVEEIAIYPNPCSASQKLNIEIGSKQNFKQMIIYSVNGEKLIESNHLSPDLSNLKTGIYFIQVNMDDAIYRTKLILKE
jgi:hypothetical protein